MTSADIKAEIENAGGPLFAQYAPHWADVFPVEPEPPENPPRNPARERWLRIKDRAGTLRPDAANALYAILTSKETGRTIAAKSMSRGAFLGRLAPFAVRISDLDAGKALSWQLVLQLLAGGDDVIDITRAEVQGMLDKAVVDGLLTSAERATFVNAGVLVCSRAEELGWGPFNYEMIITAKKA